MIVDHLDDVARLSVRLQFLRRLDDFGAAARLRPVALAEFVRRLCEAVGHAVLKLVRIQIGDLSLGDLPVGQFKVLTQKETQKALQK